MSGRVEKVSSVILTCCAVLFLMVLVRREFFGGPSAAVGGSGTSAPERVRDWSAIRAAGIPLRSPNAPIVVLEFADLECPACKQFHSTLQAVLGDSTRDVGVTLVHFPLTSHRFARPAARALECASADGAAAQFVNVAYAKQDSFGLKPWSGYAMEAGVRDTAKFAACARDTVRVNRVELGRRRGEELKLHGTPTVIINGWKFSSPPGEAQLRETISALRQGKAPPGAQEPDFRS